MDLLHRKQSIPYGKHIERHGQRSGSAETISIVVVYHRQTASLLLKGIPQRYGAAGGLVYVLFVSFHKKQSL